MIALLNMRRYEKDFLLRGGNLPVEKFKLSGESLARLLQSRVTPVAEKRRAMLHL